MKRALVISAKILLPLLFLYNVGFFDLDFSGYLKELGKSEPYNSEGQKQLTKLVNEKVKVAKAKGTNYSPADYFNDLAEITILKKSLTGVMNNLDYRLLDLSQQNVRAGLYSSRDIDLARDIFKEKTDPGSVARENSRIEISKRTFWPSVTNWLWHFYLKNLPLAFILFMLWWYKQKETFKLKNPFSFIIALIFYPIIIGLVIYEALNEKGRYYLAEAELRRTKSKMFSILSKDELEDLRRFAKSRGLTLNDWRNYLGNQGFKPQGILISSLVVTILFMAIPKFSFSQSKLEKAETNIFTTILTTQVNAPPETASITHEDENNNAPGSFVGVLDFFSYSFNPNHLNPIILKAWVKKFHPQEVILKIEHVPCFYF
jgi:hypothetical protein